MLFRFKATTKEGASKTGSIEAPNVDSAINALQKRGLIILDIESPSKQTFWNTSFFERISSEDIVIMSRQISTLFEAKVSVLSTFRLLAQESDNPALRRVMTEVTDDIKAGVSISDALAKHPKVFSDFYISMVRSGEESGKLAEVFVFLADHLDRTYALVSKTRNALIYPVFVIISFIVVMVLMLTFVVPRLEEILVETGQELPIYTKAVVALSDFFVNFGLILVVLLIAVVITLIRYLPTPAGKMSVSKLKLSVPYVSKLYQKIYLARIASNMNTLITSGVSMVRSLEITSEVVDNQIYRNILLDAVEDVRGGSSVSESLSRYEEVPNIMIQMIKVGEESGKFGFVLATMSKFYEREVENELNTLVGLIEPFMIVVLGLGVGLLLTSVLMPIYNIASGI